MKEADEWKQTGVTFFFLFHINNHTCFSKEAGGGKSTEAVLVAVLSEIFAFKVQKTEL